MRGLVILIVVGLMAWFFMQYRHVPPAKQAKWRRLALLYGGVGLLLLLILTNRVTPLLGLLGAATPWFHRAIMAKNLIERFRAQGSGGQGSVSRVQTRFLQMELDPSTGAMHGVVREGPNEGQVLADLNQAQLLELWQHYRTEDLQSAELLGSYMDREVGSAWRRNAGFDDASASGARTRNHTMSVSDAYAVLGLEVGCTSEDVVAAHRKLIQRVHPDRGGADWLAAKVNEAKTVLVEALDSRP